jgi:CHAD domain-containing protein
MVKREKLLQNSAAKAAREIAERQAASWVRVHRRLRQRGDSDALHDFRVALRRLRSTLRAFRPFLISPKGLRRRLRRLSRATNESRNLEIWQAWVAKHAGKLTERQQQGVRWLRARLHTQRQRSDARMHAQIAKWFPRLRRELAALRGAARPTPAKPVRATAAVHRVVLTGSSVLQRQLGQVHSMRDRQAAHAARIAAKRLRYLLEPFAAELRGATTIVKQLEQLQYSLGEVHDAHVFADVLRDALAEVSEQRARLFNQKLLPWPGAGRSSGRAPPAGARSGLLTLARRLRKDGEVRFAALRKEWLDLSKREFWTGLRRLGGN